MKQAANAFLFFGIGSIVLKFVGMQFIILAWIDMWGETVGWTLRGLLVAAGVVLYLLELKHHKSRSLHPQAQ